MQLEHIPRWIAASIFKWVDSNRGTGVDLLVEGQDRTKLKEGVDYFELSFNGPHMIQQTLIEYEFYVEVAILVTSYKDQKDLYKMQRRLGIALKAMAACIPVFKFGDGEMDNRDEQLGVLIRKEEPKDPVDVANFGQIEPTIQLEQGTVAANYYMCLTD